MAKGFFDARHAPTSPAVPNRTQARLPGPDCPVWKNNPAPEAFLHDCLPTPPAYLPHLFGKATVYRFCAGPGTSAKDPDPYGPPTQTRRSFDWKLARAQRLGFGR